MLVLYDRDCGFCAWVLGWLLRWDRRRRLRPVAIQSTEGERLLAGLPEQERLASWHAATESGRVVSAGAAFPPVLRTLPGGGPLAWLSTRFPRLTERAYRAVASRRTVIGPRLPRRSVARAQRLVAERGSAG